MVTLEVEVHAAEVLLPPLPLVTTGAMFLAKAAPSAPSAPSALMRGRLFDAILFFDFDQRQGGGVHSFSNAIPSHRGRLCVVSSGPRDARRCPRGYEDTTGSRTSDVGIVGIGRSLSAVGSDGSQPEFRLFHFIIAFYLLIFVQKYQKLMPKITQICIMRNEMTDRTTAYQIYCTR